MAIDWLKSAILLAYTDYTVDQAVVLSAMFETLETVFFKAEKNLGPTQLIAGGFLARRGVSQSQKSSEPLHTTDLEEWLEEYINRGSTENVG